MKDVIHCHSATARDTNTLLLFNRNLFFRDAPGLTGSRKKDLLDNSLAGQMPFL